MKQLLISTATALALFSVFQTGRAADEAAPASPATEEPAAPSPVAAELDQLVEKINAKIQAGQNTEAALATELQEFDALLAKHGSEKSDDAAQILMMKAMLYVQVFEDFDRGIAMLEQLAKDFPGTKPAEALPQILPQVKEEADAAKKSATLVGSQAPALNFEWSSRDGLKTLVDFKGKVVVLDFWATWCGPCIRSFPNLRELVDHYKGSDVEVVGVTSLQGKVHGLSAQPIDCENDPAKEHGLMPQFMKAKDVTWTVVFSKEEVFNRDYGVRGIPYVAILAPDGTVRHAGLHPGMPLAEKTAKIDALLREFGLKTPSPAGS